MSRELTHRARPQDPAIVDFYYGSRRIAELRWNAQEQDRASCDVSWDLVMVHFTGEEDWEAGTTACGDQQRQAQLIFSPDHGSAWRRQADRARDDTRNQAIVRAIGAIRERIEEDARFGIEPFPEIDRIS